MSETGQTCVGGGSCKERAQALICKAPRLALAEHYGIDFIPYVFTISATYSTAATNGSAINNQVPSKAVASDLLIGGIDIDIQTSNFNAGAILKPEADLAYDYTSGVQCVLRINGTNERSTPQFPLKVLQSRAFASPESPWILLSGRDQQVSMDFVVTTALPTSSTIITVTFVARKPVRDMFQTWDNGSALDRLEKIGCYGDIDIARQIFCAA